MITTAACNGEEVALSSFRRFKVAERAARTGRSPRTDESVKIAAFTNSQFAPANSLKTSLNTKRRAH